MTEKNHGFSDGKSNSNDDGFRDIDPNRVKSVLRYVSFGVLVFVVLFVVLSTAGSVPAGNRGVLLQFGGVTGNVLGEGLFFKFPVVQKVVLVPVQTLKVDGKASAASSDLQTVDTEIALNYHVVPSKVANVYQTFRLDYEDRFINPAIQESVKSVTAKYTAEQLITEREQVRQDIDSLLESKIKPSGFEIDAFNIVNFNFSDTFNQAIEAKVTAEQSALAAENKLAQVKFEAQQAIEQAKGVSEAIRIQGIALQNNPGVLQLKAIDKWNGILPQVTGQATPFINLK